MVFPGPDPWQPLWAWLLTAVLCAEFVRLTVLGGKLVAGKSYQVIVVPGSGEPVRTLTLPATTLCVAVIALAVGVILVASSIGLHIWNIERLHTITDLSVQNAALRTHLESVQDALARVEAQVAEGERMEQQARLLAGLVPIEEEVRLMGVGGALVGPVHVQTRDHALDGLIRHHNVRLEEVERRLALQKQSFEETLEALEQVGDRLAHTPSIPPLRDQVMVASGFGWRKDPFTGDRAFHEGLDFPAPTGTPVHATAAGTVVFAGHRDDHGLTVRVRHGYGHETVYSHLNNISARKGQRVERGELLGAVGSTGRSTGPHLHYEVHVNGSPRDPSLYILRPRTRS